MIHYINFEYIFFIHSLYTYLYLLFIQTNALSQNIIFKSVSYNISSKYRVVWFLNYCLKVKNNRILLLKILSFLGKMNLKILQYEQWNFINWSSHSTSLIYFTIKWFLLASYRDFLNTLYISRERCVSKLVESRSR